MADDLKDVFAQFRMCFPKRLLHIVRYNSLSWRRWAACIIQVVWHCYRQKKLEERMHEV
ncbi:hypothetical protein Ddye_013966 [Dipteronia dyeriana]|uniref:Uncharacterized protein n=1 Tax=Dipteronia dyeriana TaxID=168575 RepID=A0AAD9X7A1_9ROSI|nr:hypothetical protein Ddye_013966 [Dipteronia dyeriana]